MIFSYNIFVSCGYLAFNESKNKICKATKNPVENCLVNNNKNQCISVYKYFYLFEK